MHIKYIEIANFRKLLSVRVDVEHQTTLFVGANNSGKTSAMLALRRFLVEDGRKFKMHDFTLSHWSAINEIGKKWIESGEGESTEGLAPLAWIKFLPFLDLWLHVEDNELHHVSGLIPTLDWPGGLLGVRMRLEPKDLTALYKDYKRAIDDIRTIKASLPGEKAGQPLATSKLTLWPENLVDFLNRRLMQYFSVSVYALDPAQVQPPQKGQARPQELDIEAVPLQDSPLSGLIRVNEINAQRGFGDSEGIDFEGSAVKHDGRRLSDQLRSYYAKHLDPSEKPEASDLDALQAIEAAQDAFDERLKESFKLAFTEVEGLGYPGVTDPKLKVSTRLRALDGLNHEAAVSFEIDVTNEGGEALPVLRLPEDNNGLGYQNLISMIFRLMSFRDAWMRVGKAGRMVTEKVIEPLHLVLVEEPEAHLHAQVQQVFIKKAYAVLRRHPDLGEAPDLHTQLLVSTHSSHVAHETKFACLRYFRRLPAGMMGSPVPISTVINLTEVFGEIDETARFVTRYLRSQHADLFFADAAILVEGPAERMLLPNFISEGYPFLNQCYISILEIGGSHAHKLKGLIEHLGLLTLVITDLDACGETDRKATPPQRGLKQRTNNNTLRGWVPASEGIDDLLDAAEGAKVSEVDDDKLFAVRVAYQCPIATEAVGSVAAGEALANTFEDALVFDNLKFFSEMEGPGLVRKFRECIAAKASLSEIGTSMFESLKDGNKAEFALEVMDSAKFDQLKVPGYIDEGLRWLESRLRKKQIEVLPVVQAVVHTDE